ncbi:hypothetical protein VTJ83DRAFT_4290 [Remersonia thermophila]|uniref:Uncharacterized protein n=1 Tax=Remersonia thermophila TaxID=72144 RepID=A0ABR4D9L6_9PEZI
MTRQPRLLAVFALLAARRVAAAELEPFVDVVVTVDLEVRTAAAGSFAAIAPAPGAGAGAGALAEGSDGYDSCLVVEDLILGCDEEGRFDATAAPGAAERCLCCAGTHPLSTYYSSCASFVLNSASGPDASTVYSVVSDIYATCKRDITCRRGATATGLSPTTTRSPAPAACSSMADIWNSCIFKLDPTADGYDMASCVCSDSAGKRNTDIQDHASSCYPYARVSMSTNSQLVSALASVCNLVATTPTQTATNPLVFTTAGTRTGLDLPSPTPTGSSESSDSGAATNIGLTSTGLAVPGVPVPGFVAWLAHVAGWFLSLLMLV